MKQLLILLLLVGSLFARNSFQEAAISGFYEAEGYSAPGQSRFAAMISAKVDAQRRLLELIKGAKITSETTIVNGVLQSDIMVSKIKGMIQGARMTDRKYDQKSGTAMIRLAIGYKDVLQKSFQDDGFKENFEKIAKPKEPSFDVEQAVIDEIKQQPKNQYDGLIVDVSNIGMEPAYINRIYSNGKVVFDPTKIPQQVFIQRGYSSYTTSQSKAKAILDSFGTRNPLIIKATSTTDTRSDVKINSNDASVVSASNLENSFLESAKIVFVLGN
jgi:hypothetical protein